ncbi:MAG: SoxR reducing system RseC family protein [Caldicoprobacterales bacterium]|nr:SoxR reducing system RseC family protein [Clostridiales bacterium]
MKEYGEIIELQGDKTVIKIKRSSACASCKACSIGTCSDEMLITVPNSLNGKAGDYVELQLGSDQVLKASAISYLIPLSALILGVAGGYAFAGKFDWNPELTGSISGLLLMVLSFFIIRGMEPKFKKENQFTPMMVKIINRLQKGEVEDGK